MRTQLLQKEKLIGEIVVFNNGKPLLSKTKTTDYLHTSPSTLDRWRKEGVGLDFIKRPSPTEKGGRVLYHASAIADFIFRTQVKTA